MRRIWIVEQAEGTGHSGENKPARYCGQEVVCPPSQSPLETILAE
jgi:hypothetical protein